MSLKTVICSLCGEPAGADEYCFLTDLCIECQYERADYEADHGKMIDSMMETWA